MQGNRPAGQKLRPMLTTHHTIYNKKARPYETGTTQPKRAVLRHMTYRPAFIASAMRSDRKVINGRPLQWDSAVTPR